MVNFYTKNLLKATWGWYMYRDFWPFTHAGLLKQMTRREIQQKFKGSWLGLGWMLLMPVAMLLVYSFVFQTVFKARWPGAENDPMIFAFNLFAGLITFNWFGDVFTRAPQLILEQVNLVKRVIFPLPLLVWVIVIAGLFQAVLSLLVLMIGAYALAGTLSTEMIWLPLVLLMFVPWLLGFGWLLASLGVYLQDVKHIVAMVLAPILFLSPIFYPVSALPEFAQRLMVFNPLTVMIEALRASLLGGPWPAFSTLALYTATGIILAFVGAVVFARLKKGFADVL